MRRTVDKEEDGACASRIYLKFERDLLDAAGIVVCPDGLSIGRGRLERGERYNREEEVFFGSGCCLMARREMLEDVKVGDEYFDESFFMYADDTDLGWRAALRGWKSIYAPDALVYHLHSASSESYSPLKSVGLLAELGPALGFPYSSRVNASVTATCASCARRALESRCGAAGIRPPSHGYSPGGGRQDRR